MQVAPEPSTVEMLRHLILGLSKINKKKAPRLQDSILHPFLFTLYYYVLEGVFFLESSFKHVFVFIYLLKIKAILQFSLHVTPHGDTYFLHYCFTLVTWGNSKSILVLDFFESVLSLHI